MAKKKKKPTKKREPKRPERPDKDDEAGEGTGGRSPLEREKIERRPFVPDEGGSDGLYRSK